MSAADDFRTFEHAGWTREGKARDYASWVAGGTARVAGRLLDAARVGPGMRVLDVATGPGHIAGEAAVRGAHVVGVDISDDMLALARDLHRNVDFGVGDAEELPFDDGEFDAVVAGFVLHHLARPDKAIAEARRVLRSGGRAAFTTWDKPERARVIGLMRDAVDAVGVEQAYRPPLALEEDGPLVSLLASGGFDAAEVETIEFSHRARDLDELWEGLLGGSVRLSAVLAIVDEPTRRRIRAEFDRFAAEYAVDGGIDVPFAVKLASGQRA